MKFLCIECDIMFMRFSYKVLSIFCMPYKLGIARNVSIIVT